MEHYDYMHQAELAADRLRQSIVLIVLIVAASFVVAGALPKNGALIILFFLFLFSGARLCKTVVVSKRLEIESRNPGMRRAGIACRITGTLFLILSILIFAYYLLSTTSAH